MNRHKFALKELRTSEVMDNVHRRNKAREIHEQQLDDLGYPKAGRRFSR